MALSMAQSAFTGAALQTRAPTARAAAPAFTVRAAQSLQVRGQRCVARGACAQLCAVLARPWHAGCGALRRTQPRVATRAVQTACGAGPPPAALARQAALVSRLPCAAQVQPPHS